MDSVHQSVQCGWGHHRPIVQHRPDQCFRRLRPSKEATWGGSAAPRLHLAHLAPCRLSRSAKVYPIEALMADCRQYFAITGRRVTFEYTLMAGVNDGRHHVRPSSSQAAMCPRCGAGYLARSPRRGLSSEFCPLPFPLHVALLLSLQCRWFEPGHTIIFLVYPLLRGPALSHVFNLVSGRGALVQVTASQV